MEDISPPRRLAITQAMCRQIPDGAVDKPYVFHLFPEECEVPGEVTIGDIAIRFCPEGLNPTSLCHD